MQTKHPCACSVIPLHMQRHLAEPGDDDVRERIASTGRVADAWSAVGLPVPPRLTKRTAVKPPRGEWRTRKAA